MVKFKFKENAITVNTDNFWYDLTDGGYIKPEKLLSDKDQVKAVKDAVKLLKEFERQAEQGEFIVSM